MSGRSARDLASLAVRHSQAIFGGLLGTTARRLAAGKGMAAVLMYHRVLPDDADVSGIAPGMFVRESSFRHQLAWLKSRFEFRTLGQIIDEPPAPASRPAVVLTFDDGWRDNLTVAWPLLEEAGVRATIFLVRDWVSQGRNDEGEFMRPDEVAALQRQGMEFGAHTATHPHLDRIPSNSVEREMRQSKQAVEEWTGKPCNLFAYPYGHYNSESVREARRIFTASVAVGGGWWRPYGDTALIPRVGVHQDMTSTRAMLFARLAAQVV